MLPEKPKRKAKKRSFAALILLLLPLILLFRQIELSFWGDSIALTVLICSAIYIAYQGVLWLIGKTWS